MSGRMPRRSRTERERRPGQAAEQLGFGACRGERKANAARALSTTRAAIFEQKRSVANSAVANSRALGMASRTVSVGQ